MSGQPETAASAANVITTVLIVGAGTMGRQIGLLCALHDCQVRIYDRDPAALDAAAAALPALCDALVASGTASRALADAAQQHIAFVNDAATAADEADLLSESVPEDPALKAQVFAQFHALCPPRTIFTTNTSSLVPSQLAPAVGRPERFAALHFHQPIWLATVADVMPHPGTDPAVIAQLVAFARRLGQTPMLYPREIHGYLLNSMLGALQGAALDLVIDGGAAPVDVDRAWMGVMRMPIGPFGIIDGVGLDTTRDILDYWARTLGDERRRRHADYLQGFVARGALGLKSGEGFYRYPDPAYARPDFLDGEANGEG